MLANGGRFYLLAPGDTFNLDWGVPNVVELQTILNCGFGNPCIDPIFGPTATPLYWSASTCSVFPNSALPANFSSGTTSIAAKSLDFSVRAGSCH